MPDIPLEAIIYNILFDAGLREFSMGLFGGGDDKHILSEHDLMETAEFVADRLSAMYEIAPSDPFPSKRAVKYIHGAD